MKNLENYVTVNERIIEFYEKYPNGRILTEVISVNEGVVLMKASVYRTLEERTPSATGHAYEKEGSTFVNKTSYIENCETSCVGRALGNMGIAISKSIATKEEVENAINNQEILNSEKNNPLPSTIKVKYQLLKGDTEGFDDWIKSMKEKGNTNEQIEIVLTKKIMERDKK